MTNQSPSLLTTPLNRLHRSLGAKMVPFAGFDMPVQFEGVMAEHLHTRAAAGLFDVSHMGQAFVSAPSHEAAAEALEALMPADLLGLGPGQMRYALLLNDKGGICDDLMVTRPVEETGLGVGLYVVVNAACKDADFDYIEQNLPGGVTLNRLDRLALIALQGPKAVDVLNGFLPGADKLTFMTSSAFKGPGGTFFVSRSGYTGEDGFEIALPATAAEQFVRDVLGDPVVKPIGLGARDSLRLEAGLCLSGHDFDEATSPIEASLTWSVAKRRRGEANFPGAERIVREIAEGVPRKRVGLAPHGRQPAREGTQIFIGERPIGRVTSGGFGPTASTPVAMGYVETEFAKKETELTLLVRGKHLPAKVVGLPFVPHSYVR